MGPQSTDDGPDEKSTPAGSEPEFQQQPRSGPLRAIQRLVDEEQGHKIGISSIRAAAKKLVPFENPRKRGHVEPKMLEIVQTLSYPYRDPRSKSEGERQETFILFYPHAEATEKAGDDSHQIRWIHRQTAPESNVMSFDDFRASVNHFPLLHADERALAAKMLQKVQSTNGKPFAHGRYGKYLVPSVVHDPESNLTPQQAKLDVVERNASIYPITTLLQSRYHLTPREERDKKQVVRKLKHLENDKVISLPELWCLIINDHTIITYAAIDINGTDGLFGGTMKSEESPKGPMHVRYTGPDGPKCFLAAQCRTWSQLLQTLKHHDANFDYELKTRDGVVLSESNWSERLTEEISLYLDLSVDIQDSDYSSDSSIRTDSYTSMESETESEHEYVEIKPGGIEIREVRPDLRKLAFERLKTRGGRSWSLSPVRRAETIGPSLSAKQLRALGISTVDDPLGPRPTKRSATIDVSLLPDVERKIKESLPFSSSPNRSESGSNNIVSPALAQNSNEPTTTRVRIPGDLEDIAEPKQTPRKVFRSLSPPREGALRRDPSLSRPPGSERGAREGSRFVGTPRSSSPLPVADTKVTTPLLQPTRRRGVDREKKRAGERRVDRGRVDFRRSSRRPKHLRNISDETETNPIFTWPTTWHRPSMGRHVQSDPIAQVPRLDSEDRGNARGTVQPGQQPGSHPLPNATHPAGHGDALGQILEDAHNELAGQRGNKRSRLYNAVKGKTFEDVENELKRLQDSTPVEPAAGRSSASLNSLTKLEFRKETVQIAKKLYEAFVPPDRPCAIRERYWGGVYLSLQDVDRDWEPTYDINHDMQSEIQIIQTLTSEFLAKVKYISGLSQGNDTRKKFRYRITPALFKAFTSIVMFYVLHGLAGVERDRKYGLELYQACEECTDQCFELLNEGVDHLLILLHTDDDGGTVRYAEPESKTIIAMVMENLLNRPLKFETHEAEISDIYSEFISELEIRTQECASVGVFSEIKLLSEELDTIGKILEKQLQVIRGYSELVGCSGDDDRQTSSAKLRQRVFERSIKSLEQKKEEFRELKERANDMQFLASQTISIRAESNDKAIMIFTITTVIFLPLSFVTGYLGMNAEDIRNMNKKQSLFWIISAPITCVIAVAIVLLVKGPSLKKSYLRAKLHEL